MNLLDLFARKASMPAPGTALPGRAEPITTPGRHFVNGRPIAGPYPEGIRTAVFGLGCFWGAERAFWKAPGVFATAVGYAAGETPNPTYEEVCSGRTGHNEVVLVAYDPAVISYEALVKLFFESHDPTQGMRQGNDVGTQYRSGIYVADEAERAVAERVRDAYAPELARKGYGAITTEIAERGPFYFAEDYHQQYLAKNPGGYCGLGGTGVACPVGTGVAAA
ncbi:peptide-methionine (S)-S-oxide reductase MsrA [Kaistia geumhonensis]|uniref:Peptide methionine sulfoxide reductase MsrA n=1 Tax=Kaistia geumhonensis TaxID=410839 RepID=A0ABU0M6V3_9HYPH|nr:peptide-methionine (S)-S-oxide reductase MsrA [Kaistia geumhonensis]MCX5478085.1 peptide-methionine (S)-S-oxide reductase MsrA [Kaistia geumhonensis]MDQ0516699.1 peptide-methionine (S)-S-oxide reductase [Kaistia geumhonensis]